MTFEAYLQVIIGMVAIINPISTLPLFVQFTEKFPQDRAKVARISATAVAIILIVCVFTGDKILNIFSITVDSFRIAGGLLLLVIAYNMLFAKHGRSRPLEEEKQAVNESASIAVVPLAMPMLAGPGALSSAILFSAKIEDFQQKLVIASACIASAVVVWITLRLSVQITSRIGNTGMNIFTRIMGLLVASIAVEFILGGIRNSFPTLTE